MYYGTLLGILAFTGTGGLSLGIFISSVTVLTVLVILDIAVCSPYPTLPSRFLRVDETAMPLKWNAVIYALRGASLLAFLLSIRSMTQMDGVELIHYIILYGGIILAITAVGFAVSRAWRSS